MQVFTARNQVGGKVMFLHVSVILFIGGCLSHCMLGYIPPGTRGSPPRSRLPPPQRSMLGDMGNKRAIRILLECNLATFCHCVVQKKRFGAIEIVKVKQTLTQMSSVF